MKTQSGPREERRFFEYSDQLIFMLFPSLNQLKTFGVTYISLSNHLAAFMQILGLQNEIEDEEANIENYRDHRYNGEL